MPDNTTNEQSKKRVQLRVMDFGVHPGDRIACPVCGKTFTADEDTTAIIAGGYVCSWSCFMKKHRELKAEAERLRAEREQKREEAKGGAGTVTGAESVKGEAGNAEGVDKASPTATPTAAPKKRGRPKKSV